MFFVLILGIIFIVMGVFLIKYPIKALDFSMRFTIQGKRKYTNWAIGRTIAGGKILITLNIDNKNKS